ncbi:MAG: M3 family metallopeptidase [Thermodesulfobacteriota bacterium]|nr:M3 family metallopeptidase [Thermodesulfobacteriota bacterium]
MDHEKNPLLITRGIPGYDQIRAEHVEPAIRQVLKDAKERLSNMEKDMVPTWEGLIEPLNEMETPFEYAWAPVNHLLSVKNSDDLRKAHQLIQGEVMAFSLELRQNQKIYAALLEIKDSTEWGRLDQAQKRAIDLRIRDARMAGIGLEKKDRQEFNRIAQRLSELATAFSNHILDSTKAYEFIVREPKDTMGWPESLMQLASQSYNQKNNTDEASMEKGPWRITLDQPSFIPFMQYSCKRKHRETIYRAFITRASSGPSNNKGLMSEILDLRQKEAELLGFSSFAEMSLSLKMAANIPAVEEMFKELFEPARPYALQDFKEIQECAINAGSAEPMMQWDIAFWAERLREERFGYTDEDIKPYFPLPKVIDGLFDLSQRLFDIQITQSDSTDIPAWNKDVQFFDVFSNNRHIASFFLDPYSRPNEKRGGAWMDECLGRKKGRLPVVHLCCNSTPPIGEKPSLMGFREIETLFHEFGHGLQAMLTEIEYPDVSGINGVEWDAVELPSQFMENWCYHKATLMGMSSHIDTNEPLSEDLFNRIKKARTFRAGSLMMRQLEFGMTDMYLHHEYKPQGKETPFDVHRRIAEKTSVLPMLEENCFLCSFAHIFASASYAAGYYSYKWAEVLSSDAFAAFEEKGLDNEEEIHKQGKLFRETILACGGSRPAMEIFMAFRGRRPSTSALLAHSGLIQE